MEKDTYPVSKIIWNIASIILLIGFIIILFYIFYKPYYKLTVNDNFIGYYKDYNEFENLYNSIEKEYEEEGIKVVKYLPNNPLTEKTYVKESFVEKFDNKKLIEKQLKKDYTIYQILVNNEAQFYTKTKEEADALVSELKNEVKESTDIKVEAIIVQDLSLLNTDNVKRMDFMFTDCPNLKDIIGLNEINTNNVKTMESMFGNCTQLEELNLSNWQMKNVENMNRMFLNDTALTMIDFSNAEFNSNLTEYMFAGANPTIIVKSEKERQFLLSIKEQLNVKILE